jgi:hypothetical protein
LKAMDHMKSKSLKKMEAQKESEDQYKKLIWTLANASLLPSVDSVSHHVTHSFMGECGANISTVVHGYQYPWKAKGAADLPRGCADVL